MSKNDSPEKITEKLVAENRELDIDQMLAGIHGEIAKKRQGALRQVLAGHIERRTQHEFSINQIDAEIAKVIADARRGVFPTPAQGGKGGDGKGQQDAKKAE